MSNVLICSGNFGSDLGTGFVYCNGSISTLPLSNIESLQIAQLNDLLFAFDASVFALIFGGVMLSWVAGIGVGLAVKVLRMAR